MIHRVRTIDAHAGGEPLRLIVEGFPSIGGRTMAQKRDEARRRHDWLRRALILEPRGHVDMYGAILTEPVTSNALAGILFIHNAGYSTMCGHGVIAVVTIAIERHLWHVSDPNAAILLDTPAGAVQARATVSGPRVELVSFVNVPSFVLAAGVPVTVGTRSLKVDVAFGGAFYAIVDAEAAGVRIEAGRAADLRRIGMQVKQAVEAVLPVEHPVERTLRGIYGTIFTGPPSRADADLRNVTVFADEEIDRSPCGTGTSAVMAVLDAMGLLGADQTFTSESLIGTTFCGRVAGRMSVGILPAIVPEIEGSAWITGEHTFLIDEKDPLKNGFRI